MVSWVGFDRSEDSSIKKIVNSSLTWEKLDVIIKTTTCLEIIVVIMLWVMLYVSWTCLHCALMSLFLSLDVLVIFFLVFMSDRVHFMLLSIVRVLIWKQKFLGFSSQTKKNWSLWAEIICNCWMLELIICCFFMISLISYERRTGRVRYCALEFDKNDIVRWEMLCGSSYTIDLSSDSNCICIFRCTDICFISVI